MPRGEAGDRAPGAAAAQGHGSQVRLVAEESVAVPHASHLRMQNDTTESTAACSNPGVRISFVKAKKKKKVTLKKVNAFATGVGEKIAQQAQFCFLCHSAATLLILEACRQSQLSKASPLWELTCRIATFVWKIFKTTMRAGLPAERQARSWALH